MDEKTKKGLREKAEKQGLNAATRHIYFCGASGCCQNRDGAKESWKTLGKRLKDLKKAGIEVRRCEVECFSLCRGGPLVVVYPEAVWYGGVDAEAMTRIVDEHLVKGEIVEDLVFARSEKP